MAYLEVLGRAHFAIGLAATGQRQALAETLAQQRRFIRDTCLAYFECEVALVEAWDALAHDGEASSHKLLGDALRLGRETGCLYVNIFRVTSMFRDVLSEALEAGIETDYVTDLIQRLRITPAPGATDRWPLAPGRSRYMHSAASKFT